MKNENQIWEIQTYTLCDGWVNTWTDGETNKPLTFASQAEAEKELKDYIKDLKAEVKAGNIEDYDGSEFRVQQINS